MKAIFTDTNLFLQCRDLKDLPWEKVVGGGENLLLLIPRTVQEEIDRLKHDGNNRRAKRAKNANAMIRQIILTDDTKLILKTDNPLVEITFPPPINITSPPHEILDLSRPDDCIIAEALIYKKTNPSTYVALITHDTNPILTSKRCNLPVIIIPDDWLLEPEPDTKDKRLVALEKRLVELEKNLPAINVVVINDQSQEISSLSVKITKHPALTDEQVGTIVEILKAKFPMATDFSPESKPFSSDPLGFRAFVINQRYEAPTESRIKRYQEKEYPAWIESLRNTLHDLSTKLESRFRHINISFLISNGGGVPAENLVVEFNATSGIFLKYSDDDDESVEESSHPQLPQPPQIPKGQWVAYGIGSLIGRTNNYAMLRPESHFLNIPSLRNPSRDRNSFYWKPERPPKCFPNWAYECEEFRHKVEPEEFPMTIYFPPEIQSLKASIKCRITAKNMPEPLNFTLPVQIQYETGDTLQVAINLVENMS